jgi:hypothetical protein
MSKDRKYILSGGIAIILGWLSGGFGFTTKLGHPISTICFCGGMLLCFLGIIFFIIGANTKSHKR